MAGRGGRPADPTSLHFTKNAAGSYGCNYCDFAMKVFSAKRARYHLAATEKYAASYVKMCASPPPLVKKQFLDIIVEDAAKVLKRKAESAVKEDALAKKHKSTASALKQKQERRQPTIGQSLSGSVTKQVCDLAIARFFFANGISNRAIESKTWQRCVKKLSKQPVGYKSPGRQRLGTELLDALHKSAEDEAAAVFNKVDGQGRTATGDGASFAKKVLVNFLVHVPGHAPILVDVVDANAHLASGGTKDGRWIADQLVAALEKA